MGNSTNTGPKSKRNVFVFFPFNWPIKIFKPCHKKTSFCIIENKAADQLCGNRTTDQRLCFRYTDSTIPLLPKSEISSLQLSSVVAQPSLCRTWSETPKTGFLTLKLIWSQSIIRCGKNKRLNNGPVNPHQYLSIL